jgi:hypothetical protein
MPHNPMEDDAKLYSNKEWAEVMKEEIDAYVKEFDGQNDFHTTNHTWSDWHNSFIRYMSW